MFVCVCVPEKEIELRDYLSTTLIATGKLRKMKDESSVCDVAGCNDVTLADAVEVVAAAAAAAGVDDVGDASVAAVGVATMGQGQVIITTCFFLASICIFTTFGVHTWPCIWKR